MQGPEALLQEVEIILRQRPSLTVVEHEARQLFVDSNRTSEAVHDHKVLLEFRTSTLILTVHGRMVK
jgi:hypothetical protein